MVQTPVTKAEALIELQNVKKELERWKQYRNAQAEQYELAKKVGGIHPDFFTPYIKGLLEAESNIEFLADVYQAQLNYCRKRGWME
jgi:hypothetical protein